MIISLVHISFRQSRLAPLFTGLIFHTPLSGFPPYSEFPKISCSSGSLSPALGIFLTFLSQNLLQYNHFDTWFFFKLFQHHNCFIFLWYTPVPCGTWCFQSHPGWSLLRDHPFSRLKQKQPGAPNQGSTNRSWLQINGTASISFALRDGNPWEYRSNILNHQL